MLFEGESLRKWNLELKRDSRCPLIQLFSDAPLWGNFKGLHHARAAASRFVASGLLSALHVKQVAMRKTPLHPSECRPLKTVGKGTEWLRQSVEARMAVPSVEIWVARDCEQS
jgi:hypothetical protein